VISGHAAITEHGVRKGVVACDSARGTRGHDGAPFVIIAFTRECGAKRSNGGIGGNELPRCGKFSVLRVVQDAEHVR
jgi:hypothetical protein